MPTIINQLANDVQSARTRAVGVLQRTRRRFSAGFWTRGTMKRQREDGQYEFCFVGGITEEAGKDRQALNLAYKAFGQVARYDPVAFNDAHRKPDRVIEKIDEAIQLLESGYPISGAPT